MQIWKDIRVAHFRRWMMMTFNEKESILYMAQRLVNELLEADDSDFVDAVTNAIANAELDTLEYMVDDLYGVVQL